MERKKANKSTFLVMAIYTEQLQKYMKFNPAVKKCATLKKTIVKKARWQPCWPRNDCDGRLIEKF